jgi:peptidyl-dipeptidase A
MATFGLRQSRVQSGMQTLQSFIDDQQLLAEALESAAESAYWIASISGTQMDEVLAAKCGAELRTAYSNPDRLELLKSFPDPDDHDLARQKLILIDLFTEIQFTSDVIQEISSREMEIESLFSNFRADLNGSSATENMLRQILKDSNNVSERVDAWRASKQIGAVAAPKVLELIRMRNREAKRLGFDNYYAMQIKLQELDETELFTVLESVSSQLDPAFSSLKSELDSELSKRFGTTPDKISPWHYSDTFFQTAPDSPSESIDHYFENNSPVDIAILFFRAIGFDINAIIEKSDLFEKPGKMQHAYCTKVGRGTHDVRILCNIVPDARWMETLLHELGHAVYDVLIDDSLPYFLRTVTHTMTTEAIAQIMGRFIGNGAWLSRYVGVAPEDAERVTATAAKSQRAHLIIFAKWVLVMANFERELYRNPDQDIDSLWWRIVEKYQQIKEPEDSPKSTWASKIHLATSPVYYHNYLLGEMTASQLLATIKRDVAPTDRELISSPAVGEWLTQEIFRTGSRYAWSELLKRATGDTLNPKYFVDELA